MRSTGRTGLLTGLLKEAGVLSAAGDVARGAAVATEGLGRAVWHGAGAAVPNPVARAALLGATGVGAATQGPELAGRWARDAQYIRGESSDPARGF